MINTEWLARIRGCDVQDCYPFFAQARIGCTCWGFVAGKYQTYEPWEGMWRQVERGYRGFDMTKWFHDLYRPSLRPYDPEEIDIIKRVNAQMDAELKGESLRAKIAKAGIPALLVYGTSDVSVKPGVNSKAFLSKFKAAGGDARIREHSEYGHHPHGVEGDEKTIVIDFFASAKGR